MQHSDQRLTPHIAETAVEQRLDARSEGLGDFTHIDEQDTLPVVQREHVLPVVGEVEVTENVVTLSTGLWGRHE